MRPATARAASTEDEAHYDRLGARFEVALRGLLRTAAPNVAALASKLELAFAHEVSTLSGGDACLTALTQDARRLAERHG